MQGRGRFFIILGVVLLALAIVGVVLIVVLQGRGGGIPGVPILQPEEAGPEAQPTEVIVEMSDVVVALQNIREGEKIRPDAVGVRPVSKDELPSRPILNTADVVNKLARQDIFREDVLVSDMVIAVEDVQRLGWRASPLIPEDRVAVAFPVSQLSSVNYAIHPGDRVDVIVCGAFIDVDPDTQIKTPLRLEGDESCEAGCQVVGEQVQRTFCQLTVDDAEVLGIGSWGAPQQPTAEEEAAAEGQEGETSGDGQLPQSFDTIIMMVKPQDAVVLMYFLKNDYLIDLALRARSDEERHEPEQVTLEYVMTRFRLSPPSKLPYRLEPMRLPETTIAPAPPVE